ncbi:MAG: chemotaxis protein CheW [Iphinoe sp. HA4291-MV1]|nr:chemotaxis protein CheW [Iphinoe sp. HA4291-MV1]
MPEQQQRILGYFIEESKDHLNIIEQGLLNLQNTFDNPEMINEVFRAAHSIKGDAAMLGLSSIQYTAHRLEDCFTVLKEHPIQVDQKLVSLFLGVSNTLRALLESWTEPFGLTEDIAQTLISETEPIFKSLHEHLKLLVQQTSNEATKNINSLPKASPATLPQPVPTRTQSWQNLQTVQSQVIRTLREMLQLFKKTATPQTRQRLYECCHQLVELGEELNWSNWCGLCRITASAIANPENTYLTLAKIVITEIKQALELVSAGREPEITISQQLQALVRVEEAIELLEIPLELADELATPAELLELPPTISSSTIHLETEKEVPQTRSDAASTELLDIEPQDRITCLFELSEQFNSNDNAPLTNSSTDTNSPEVEIAQLNTLADLFEGESSDLHRTWDKEEILDINAEDKLGIDLSNSNTEDSDKKNECLISEETISGKHQSTRAKEESSLQLFDELLEENLKSASQETTHLTIELDDDKIVTLEDIREILQGYSEQSISASEKIQDEVSSLLELVLDENQPLPIGEINQTETEIIPDIELSKNQVTSFDDLFLQTAKAEPIQEVDSLNRRESETISHQDEILTLEELVTEVEEDNSIIFSGNKSADADLFAVLPETEDLNNFWEPEMEGEKGEFYPAIQQDTANDLEEVLLGTAAEDIFDDVEQPLNSILASVSWEDSDLNFQSEEQLEEQQFHLLFSSETDEDLFQDLTPDQTTSSSIDTTLDAIDAQNTAYYRIVPKTEKNVFSQQPEAVELIPEFTTSPSETEPFIEEPQDFLNSLLFRQPPDGISFTLDSESSQENFEILDIEAETISQLDSELDLNEDFLATEAVSSEKEFAQEVDISLNDEFSELDKLLDQKVVSDINAGFRSEEITSQANLFSAVPNQVTSETDKRDLPHRPFVSHASKFEQLMKIPVKHLDDLSHLVGELVVNRNTLEQDQERLRQFLDNLQHQLQQLNDVGTRMQELYDRSLLDASLLTNRRHHGGDNNKDTDRDFTELEMDRFTPFHTLAQEMIKLIVRVREAASDIDFVTKDTEQVTGQFRQVTKAMQESITRSRKSPFAEVTTPLERGVRESAIKCGKQAQLVIEGRETSIDKLILEHLKSPLTHLLNNAIAHGIETPEVRQAIAKPPVGVITIGAFHQGNQTVISVTDDGAGIDIEAVKAKAIKMGMITSEQAKIMSDHHVYDLLFQPGFSTKEKEDEFAGRGVGLDVVLTRIHEIRGTISIDSIVGKGTTFTIRLPLTLSICKALCCVFDRACIAFPMDGVEDILNVSLKTIQQHPNEQKYMPWRDTLLPLRSLKEILTFNSQLSRGRVCGQRDDDMVSVVVVRSANVFFALQVDQVLNEQEIVIQQFEGPFPKPIGVAGATILDDGRIMPIADVLEIINIFQGRTSKQCSK